MERADILVKGNRVGSLVSEMQIQAVSLKWLIVGCLGGVVSCSHSPKDSAAISSIEITATQAPLAPKAHPAHLSGGVVLSPSRFQPNHPISVQGVPLVHTDFDVPVVINKPVEQWIDYFTGRGRRVFGVYLKRADVFIPFLQDLLSQAGLPQDLVYLAMIESGFNPKVRSHARAVGTWQFIRSTGKRYGLKINWWVDERRDVKQATWAAISYLKDLYQHFGSWELAAASYNAGERKVARAIERYGSRNFWTLTRQRFLRPETRNYVPKWMAAAIIAKNRSAFGFPEASVSQDIQLTQSAERKPSDDFQSIQLAAATVGSDEVLQQTLREYEKDYRQRGESLPAQYHAHHNTHQVPLPVMARRGKVEGKILVDIEIRSPVNLFQVAKAAGISYHELKKYNPAFLRWCAPPSMKTIRIKIPKSKKDQFLVRYNHPAFPKDVKFRKYKIRRGDTLLRVARRFGLSTWPIRSLNGLGRKSILIRGKTLLLPLPSDRSQAEKI